MQPTTHDLATFREFVATADWVTARSERYPHRYVVRGKQVDDPLFTDMVRLIRQYGTPGNFHTSYVLIYWIVDGERFWTMGGTLDETIIINRAASDQVYGRQTAPTTVSPHVSVYDRIAPDYDARYRDRASRLDDLEVARRLLTIAPDWPRVLDVGAGTGLFLDLLGPDLAVDAESYVAVDPSQAMLNELVRKHPWVRHVHPTPFEDTGVDGKTDLVVALYGAASYLPPDAVERIPSLLSPDGRALLMFYAPGYLPDIHTETPPTAEPARKAAEALPGAQVDTLGSFTVVTL